MIRNYSVAVMALVQTLFISVGVALTAGIVKTFNDIGREQDWNPAALAVRQHGQWLLLIPLTWTIFSLLMERRDTGHWTRKATLVTGLLVLAAACGFLGWTAMTPYFRHNMPMGIV